MAIGKREIMDHPEFVGLKEASKWLVLNFENYKEDEFRKRGEVDKRNLEQFWKQVYSFGNSDIFKKLNKERALAKKESLTQHVKALEDSMYYFKVNPSKNTYVSFLAKMLSLLRELHPALEKDFEDELSNAITPRKPPQQFEIPAEKKVPAEQNRFSGQLKKSAPAPEPKKPLGPEFSKEISEKLAESLEADEKEGPEKDEEFDEIISKLKNRTEKKVEPQPVAENRFSEVLKQAPKAELSPEERERKFKETLGFLKKLKLASQSHKALFAGPGDEEYGMPSMIKEDVLKLNDELEKLHNNPSFDSQKQKILELNSLLAKYYYSVEGLHDFDYEAHSNYVNEQKRKLAELAKKEWPAKAKENARRVLEENISKALSVEAVPKKSFEELISKVSEFYREIHPELERTFKQKFLAD